MTEVSHLLAVAELAAFFPENQHLTRGTRIDFPLGNLALVLLLESGGDDSWGALESARAALAQDSSLEERYWYLDGKDEIPLVEAASSRAGWDEWRATNQERIQERYSLLEGFEPFAEEFRILQSGGAGIEVGRGGRSAVIGLNTTINGHEFVAKLPRDAFPGMGYARGLVEDYVGNLVSGVRGFESIEGISYLPAIVSERAPGVDLEDLTEAKIEGIPATAVIVAAQNLVQGAGLGIHLDRKGVRNWRYGESLETGEGVFTFLDYYRLQSGHNPKLAALSIMKFAQGLYRAGSGQKMGGIAPPINYTPAQRRRRTQLLDVLHEEAARLCPDDPTITERIQQYRTAAG